MHYDLERLVDDLELPTGGLAAVKLNLFRHWVHAKAP
jgi:hypothetical protein